jgi:hypothetical protein
MRGQRFCSFRCRDRARGRSRKAYLGRDTRASITPAKANNLPAIIDESSPAKNALRLRVIRVEYFDSHQWAEKISPDGVKVWVTQLRQSYRYGG